MAAPAALLLCALPLVAAHDDEPMDNMNMGKSSTSTSAATSTPQATGMASNYFTYPEHTGLIYAHIAFMVIAWLFILPICNVAL